MTAVTVRMVPCWVMAYEIDSEMLTCDGAAKATAKTSTNSISTAMLSCSMTA